MNNTYRERIAALQRELGAGETELGEKIRMKMRKEGSRIDASDFQLTSWLTPSAKSAKALPPVEALPFIADALGTNIGYLFGLHDIREMTNSRLSIDVDIERCDKEYKRKHEGRSMQTDGVILNQWYLKLKRKKDIQFRIKPFINMSKALNWDVDYILGLSDVKNWQYFCLENGLLDRIPEGTRFLLDDNETIATLGKNSTLGVIKDGLSLQISLDQLLSRDPKIICGYTLLD